MSERRPVKDEVITLACEPGCPQTWEHRWRGEDKVDKVCPYCGRINQYWFGQPARLLVEPKYNLAWGPFGHCNQCGSGASPVSLRRDPFTAEVSPEDDNPKSYWCENCWDLRKDDV